MGRYRRPVTGEVAKLRESTMGFIAILVKAVPRSPITWDPALFTRNTFFPIDEFVQTEQLLSFEKLAAKSWQQNEDRRF